MLALVGACVVAMPAAAFVAGVRATGVLADPALVRATAVAVGATGTMIGLTLGLTAPTTLALGVPLAAAPVRAPLLALASTVAPVLAAVAGAVVLALLFAVPAAGAVGAAAVLAGVASLLLGAAGGAALRDPLRRRPAPAALAAVAATWLLGGAVGGLPEAGPGAAVLRAGAASGVGLAAAVAIVGIAVWVLAAPTTASSARRRPRRRHRRSGTLPLPGTRALAAAVTRTLVRHRELRGPAVAAVLLPVAATYAAALLLDVRGEAGTAFAVGLALAAAMVFPAASHGVVAEAHWLLAAAPQRLGALHRAATSGGVAVAFGVVVCAAVGAAPMGAADARTYLELEAATALVLGAAAAAGAIVAWRPRVPLQQASAYGAAAVAAATAWAVAAQGVQHAAALGVGSTAYALVVGHAALAGGVLSTGIGSR